MQANKQCCSDCPLASHGARGFVPDNIPVGAQYLIIGEAPGKTEVAEGRPFAGKSEFVLRNWMLRPIPTLQIALERGKIGFSNVLKCMPVEVGGRMYPTGQLRRDAEAHCAPLTKIPDTINTVILCGEAPQRFYFGDELEKEDAVSRSLGRDVKGIMGRVGRVYEKDGKRWVFSPHPSAILRSPALVGQAQEALKIAAGLEKTLESKIVRWDEALLEIK